jgi:tripartite ATP-independent transporter DctM subunit
MEWYWAALLLIALLLFMMACGIPVALAFLSVDAIGGYLFMGGFSGLQQFVSDTTVSITSFALVPVPLFILMGELFFHSGLSFRVFDVLDKVLGRLPGRLSYLTVVGGTIFATLSGSSLANTAMLGETMIPEMTSRGYKRYMAIGPILGTGGLAMIIPPSTLAVLLGSIGRINVGGLLVGGILPGLVLAGLYMLTIFIRVTIDKEAAPSYSADRATPVEAVKLLTLNILPMSIVIFAVIGGILAGITTPTEASAFGVLAVFILTLVYRACTWDAFKKAIFGTARLSGMILFIVVGSSAFSQILTFSGATGGLLQWAISLDLTAMGTLVLMFVVVLVLGMFMDQVSIMLITLPIFMPLVHHFGLNPVWFGIIVLLGLEIGLVSPPFGMELFIMKGVAPRGTTLREIIRAGFPFLLCAILTVILIMNFPALVTTLAG